MVRNIFCCLTPFHLYQALAIIQSSYHEDSNTLITIDIIPAEIISNLRKENIFTEIHQLPVLEFKKKFFNSHNKILNIISRILARIIIKMYFPFPKIDFHCSRLFVFNDQATISDWLFYNIRKQNKIKPQVIHLPDGFGTFYQEEKKENAFIKLYKKLKYIIGSSFLYSKNNCLGESQIVDEFQVINPMNFPVIQPKKITSKMSKIDNKIESFIVSPSDEFRNLIYSVYNLESVETIRDKFKNKKSIILYTQPAWGLHIKDIQLKKFYTDIIDKLKELSFDIILKPHPRQTKKDFEFLSDSVYIIPPEICVEALLTGFPELFLSSYHLTAYSTVEISLLSYLKLPPSKLILYHKLLNIEVNMNKYLLKIEGLYNIFAPASMKDLETYLMSD